MFEKPKPNDPREISEKEFYYYLEILPPQFMNHDVKLQNGRTVYASFGFAEGGYTVIDAYWKENGKYFTAPTVHRTDIFGQFMGFPQGETSCPTS